MKIIIIVIILAVIIYLVYHYLIKPHNDSKKYINDITLPNANSFDKYGKYYGCQRKKCANQDVTRSYDLCCKNNQCYCRYYKRIVNKKMECPHYADSFNSPDFRNSINALAELYDKEHKFD